MDIQQLIDPVPAAIVCGGTLIATALRCGRTDMVTSFEAVKRLVRPSFRAERLRGDLAPVANIIRQDGVYRARANPTGDPEFDEAIDAMIQARSAAVLMVRHAANRKRRMARTTRAVLTLSQAADLAPVFGLAGTLVSLAQLSQHGIARAMFMSAISMSVLATLYGLLLANFILAPLARAVERRSEREEAQRQEIVDWLASQFASVSPRQSRGGRDSLEAA